MMLEEIAQQAKNKATSLGAATVVVMVANANGDWHALWYGNHLASRGLLELGYDKLVELMNTPEGQ